MVPGRSVAIAGKTITLNDIRRVEGPNYEALQAAFRVETLAGSRSMMSERRLFPASQTTTTEAAINVGLLGNVYISVGDRAADGGLVVRIWNHPLVNFIWGGAFLMAFGGVLSLADRRLRVAWSGAPRGRRQRLRQPCHEAVALPRAGGGVCGSRPGLRLRPAT